MNDKELIDFLLTGGELSTLSDEDFNRLVRLHPSLKGLDVQASPSLDAGPDQAAPELAGATEDPIFNLLKPDPNSGRIQFNNIKGNDVIRAIGDLMQIGTSFVPGGAGVRIGLGTLIGAGQGAAEAPEGQKLEGALDRGALQGSLSLLGEAGPLIKEMGLRTGTRLAKLPDKYADPKELKRLRDAFREQDVRLGDVKNVKRQRSELNPQLQAKEESVNITGDIRDILPYSGDQLRRASIDPLPITTRGQIGNYWAQHLDEQSRELGKTPLPGTSQVRSPQSRMTELPAGTPDEVRQALEEGQNKLVPTKNQPPSTRRQQGRLLGREPVQQDIPTIQGEVVDEAPKGTILDANGRPISVFGGPQDVPRRFEATAREMGERGRGARARARNLLTGEADPGLHAASKDVQAQSSAAIGKAYQDLVRQAAAAQDPELAAMIDKINRQISNTYRIQDVAPHFSFRTGQASVGGGLGSGMAGSAGLPGPARTAAGIGGFFGGAPGLLSAASRGAAKTVRGLPPLVRTGELLSDVDLNSLVEALRQMEGNK